MTNIKDPIDRTKNRVVSYLNDSDYDDFMMILADRGMRAGHYVRLLLCAHIQALRDNKMLVTPAENEIEDL